MLSSLAIVAVSLVLLIWSADRLVLGASAVAARLGINPLLIGLTIVALGTSAPEIMVGLAAIWDDNPGILLGNVFGSNIANIGLILGATALIKPVLLPPITLRRDFPLLLGVMVLTTLFMLNLQFSRLDGIIFLGLMVFIIGWLIRSQMKQPDQLIVEEPETKGVTLPWAIIWLLVGLVLLPLSSDWLVKHAAIMARYFGVSDVFIGLSLIAIGTSLPELAASITSIKKNQVDLAVGNIVGSNLFNLLAVLGLPALLHGYAIDTVVLRRDLPVMFGITLLLGALAYLLKPKHYLNRWHGAVLLLAYCLYITFAGFSQWEYAA